MATRLLIHLQIVIGNNSRSESERDAMIMSDNIWAERKAKRVHG